LKRFRGTQSGVRSPGSSARHGLKWAPEWTWSGADGVIVDTRAPQAAEVRLRAGRVEIEWTEEVDPQSANTTVTIDGAQTGWELLEDRYTLRSILGVSPLAHTVTITPGIADLSGKGSLLPLTVDFAAGAADRLGYRRADPTEIPTSSAANLYGFHGHEVDPATGLVYMRNRWYDPAMGRFVAADPLGYVDGPSAYGFGTNDPANRSDPMGLAVYAFDGTWNDAQTMKNPTNVTKLARAYRGGDIYYRHGVGVRDYPLLGGASGFGGRARLELMLHDLASAFQKGDREIVVLGFSRGAALARTFVNMIAKHGVPDLSSAERVLSHRTKDGDPVYRTIYRRWYRNVRVRFLGIFDTVGSFGLPGNSVDVGYDLGIPANVDIVRHATARHEFRKGFPLTSVIDPRCPDDPRIVEEAFFGAHSDVGGGYDDNDWLAHSPLNWMWSEMRAAGLNVAPLSEADRVLVPTDQQHLFAHDPMSTLEDPTSIVAWVETAQVPRRLIVDGGTLREVYASRNACVR
jgi:RHS repeat-associated protein